MKFLIAPNLNSVLLEIEKPRKFLFRNVFNYIPSFYPLKNSADHNTLFHKNKVSHYLWDKMHTLQLRFSELFAIFAQLYPTREHPKHSICCGYYCSLTPCPSQFSSPKWLFTFTLIS